MVVVLWSSLWVVAVLADVLHLPPPVPYTFPLRCLAGSTRKTLISCPLASTACGYLEQSDEDGKGVYSCIDESVLKPGSLSEGTQLWTVCGAVPACATLPPGALSVSAASRFSLNASQPIRLCCSLYHTLLTKLATDVHFMPEEPQSITCAEEDCDTGAIGCLVHVRELAPGTAIEDMSSEVGPDYGRIRRRRDDVDGIKPVHLSFNDVSDEEEEEYQIVEESVEGDDDDLVEEISHCVYRHLHDDLYKYCLLVHSKKDNIVKCVTVKGHTVCCCFVPPGSSTCDPLRVGPPKALPTLPARNTTSTTTTIPTTTTTITTTTTSKPTTRKAIVTTRKQTTTQKTTTPDTPKCEVSYEKQLGGKKRLRVLCSAFHISPAYLFSFLLFLFKS